MVHDLYLVQVKAPADVKDKWDYYNLKEIVPGDEKPGVETKRFDDPRLTVCEGISVPRVADRVGRALLVR